MKYFITLLSLLTLSCNWAKQKTKETINKSGEVAAKTGSEFIDGVSKGVEKTFENKVKISGALSKDGLHVGKVLIQSSDSATDNKLGAYLIYNNTIDKKVTIKIFTESGDEYGRLVQTLKGNKGEAGYVDFIFDKRTNIDSRGTITIE